MNIEVLQYGDHKNQHIDFIHNPTPLLPDLALPTLVYIHGGAWRDPNNTSRDVLALSEYLQKTIPFASVEYRLSPEVKYPEHLNDVISGIDYLMKQHDIKKISLIGHSVGATLLLQLLDNWEKAGKDTSVLDSVYLVDGIYDLEELVNEYPDYEGFVQEANDVYKNQMKLRAQPLQHIKTHVIQSYQDELLSLKQTQWLIHELEKHQIDYKSYIANLGKHDEVYKSPELAYYINTTFY